MIQIYSFEISIFPNLFCFDFCLYFSVSPTHAELEITNREIGGEMVVGKNYPVTCTVHGSRPPPRITWFINSKPLGKLLFKKCVMF